MGKITCYEFFLIFVECILSEQISSYHSQFSSYTQILVPQVVYHLQLLKIPEYFQNPKCVVQYCHNQRKVVCSWWGNRKLEMFVHEGYFCILMEVLEIDLCEELALGELLDNFIVEKVEEVRSEEDEDEK